MSHLGQRLSALIDGELDAADRDRVLVHLARCEPCRSEAVALRALKRRMSALGETADSSLADSSLTGRLMGLASFPGEGFLGGRYPAPAWSRLAAAGHGPGPAQQGRPGWYVSAGAMAVLLAGVGTAAFMAGGSPGVPAPRVTPAVDVYLLQHDIVSGVVPAAQPTGQAAPQPARSAAPRAVQPADPTIPARPPARAAASLSP